MIKQVAVVDDNATHLKLMSYLVQQVTGSLPDSFADPYCALEALLKKEYDLLLLDHDMPKLNGLEVLKLLAERQRLPTKIAIVTAVCEPLDLEASLPNATIQLISKPFEVSGLRTFIQRALSDK